MKYVALGGGHGLAVTLKALRTLSSDLTAVVGVSDNGGSSGRLREEFGILPPGDLRMAVTALCADPEKSWAELLQYRFQGTGHLSGHAVGNLLITALWESRKDIVAGLDTVCELLNAQGRVLPLALSPIDLVAETIDRNGEIQLVSGQVEIATTSNRVNRIHFDADSIELCPQTLAAIQSAEVIVMGPGSWFTSVLTHLALPGVATQIQKSSATKILILNLVSQQGETENFSPAEHLQAIRNQNPEINFDYVLIDDSLINPAVEALAGALGWRLVASNLIDSLNSAKHDPQRLAAAISAVVSERG